MEPAAAVARYCAWVAFAAACAVALVLRPPSVQPQAWLDCTRITPATVLEPDLVTICTALAAVSVPARQASPAGA